MQIAVIDYGMGNLRSVSKAIEHVAPDARVLVTDDANRIEQSDRVVFPGQGAAKDCMQAIHDHHLDEVVRHAAGRRPFLGICMGLQVLMEHSAENGGTSLLGLIEGDVVRFPAGMPEAGEARKVPHMGWNEVIQADDHPLWSGIPDRARFYFIHSYYIRPEDSSIISGQTRYGEQFTSAIARDNLFAVQFHPEKSAIHGLGLLKNFVNWDI